jgi:hypothetical protein
MRRILLLAAVLAGIPSASAWAQNAAGGGVLPPNEVDQAKVDLAVANGIKYLKANNAAHLAPVDRVGRKMSSRELVLYTYACAGVPEIDADFKTLFDDMMKDKLEATYCVALQAMALEEIERVKYQKRIAQCAKFLVDNQGPQGFWSYGSPSIYVEDSTYDISKRKDVAPVGAAAGGGMQFVRTKPAVKNKVKVRKDRDGEGHDNSNTQYAALGCRACVDSGIVLEEKVIDASMKWLRDCQKKDKEPAEELIEGGLNGPVKPADGRSKITKKASPQGWCYSDHAEHKAYGAMTAGAVGSLAIWDYIKDNDEGKKRSWKNDTDIHEGLVWLANNFSVAGHPGPMEHYKFELGSKYFYFDYLYALERAGMLYGTEIMSTVREGMVYDPNVTATHKWYPEGAKVLIETQGATGSWGSGTVDTCFAILFLKRATQPLSATPSPGQK